MDRLVSLLVRFMIWFSSLGPILHKLGLIAYSEWTPEKPLKILLVGYTGKRNTGSDARVKEIVSLLNHLFGIDSIRIGVLTQNPDGCREYFNYENVTLLRINPIYFWDTLKYCSAYHLALLVEGSTLKSKFANALTLFFCQAAGIMARQKKHCIAFGSEAGYMDGFVKRCASKHCRNTYFVARTKQSLEIIQSMGLEGSLGTDTAWTFESTHEEWAVKTLKSCGWDGSKPLLGLSVINPFFWPVYPSLSRFVASSVTGSWKNHYDKFYFFSSDQKREEKFSRYIDAIAASAESFIDKYDAFPVIIGMEALDKGACRSLKEKLGGYAPIFSSEEYNAYELTGILRTLSLLLTSRYHARVLSLPAGVPAIALSMDERLYNIYDQLGHEEDYYFSVDENNLTAKLNAAFDSIWENRDSVAHQLQQAYPSFLETMGGMGLLLHDRVTVAYDNIAIKEKPMNWQGALPSAHSLTANG